MVTGALLYERSLRKGTLLSYTNAEMATLLTTVYLLCITYHRR